MNKHSAIIDNSVNIHPYVKKNGMLLKKSQAENFPLGVNIFEELRRFSPKTTLTTGVAVSDGRNTEIEIDNDNGGFCDRQWIEITLQELGGSNPATLQYQLIHKDIEQYINGKKDKFHTYLPEELGYLWFLELPFEQLRKIRLTLGINADYTPIANTIPAGGSRTFYIELPLIRGSPFDIRHIRGGINYKFNFNAASVFCASGAGLSQNVGISSINILCRQINIPKITIPKDTPLVHKWINWVRNSDSINMTASRTYNSKLSSIKGLCSHLVIMFRTSSPIGNYANYNTFLGNIQDIKLVTQGDKDIGLPVTRDMSNYVFSDILNSDFLAAHPSANNLFILPFNMNPSMASMGVSYGQFHFTGEERLKITTNASFSTADVTIDCWGAMYGLFEIHSNGDFKYLENITY